MPRLVALLLAAALSSGVAAAETRSLSSSYGPLEARAVGPAFAHPWSLAFLPDFPDTGALLVTERDGRLWLVDDAETRRIDGLPEIVTGGQAGLFDVTLSLDFETDSTLWLVHAAAVGDGANTAVTAARLDRDAARLTDLRRIFTAEPGSRGGRHFGGRLTVARDGTLFLTTGDRGDDDTSQDPFHANGKVHRFHRDGAIPADNPFADGREALPTVWSLGHRNPQGADLHPETGDYWLSEHGARGGDEINKPLAGLNYGWPVISYGTHYSGAKIGVGTHKEGMEQPLHYWDPSIAPSGTAFYSGDLFPDWRGDLFVGALRGVHLARLRVEGDRVTPAETLFQGRLGRIRDVRAGPDGALWLLTDERDGRLWRVAPEGR